MKSGGGIILICRKTIKIMKIWTYYYSKIKDLPEEVLPISIAGWGPKGLNFPEYRKLAPKKEWFWEYKENKDQKFYKKKYSETVLNLLTPEEVYKDLMDILNQINQEFKTNYTDVALCCYEKSEDFCHRHLFASWFSCKGFGTCEEYNDDSYRINKYLKIIKKYENLHDFKEVLGFVSVQQELPQEEGNYLTLRLGLSGLHAAVNYWNNGEWLAEAADGCATIAWKKEKLIELDNYDKILRTRD